MAATTTLRKSVARRQVQALSSVDLGAVYSLYDTSEARDGSRVRLDLAFCGQRATFVFVYGPESNREEASASPPDIILPSGDEFLVDLEELTSLREWSADNDRSLAVIIAELLTLYTAAKKQEAMEFRQDDRIEFELSTVAGIAGAEFFLDVRDDMSAAVNCLIPLDVDLQSQVPAGHTEQLNAKSAHQAAKLHARFAVGEPASTPPTLALQLPPYWVEKLPDFKPPSWESAACLMDYIPAVTGQLANRVSFFAQGFVLREQLIRALVSAFQDKLLEYDSSGFRRATFVFKRNKFSAICHFNLPSLYPQERPTLTFETLAVIHNNRPAARQFSNYNYSPSWDAYRTVEELRLFTPAAFDQFQAYCYQPAH